MEYTKNLISDECYKKQKEIFTSKNSSLIQKNQLKAISIECKNEFKNKNVFEKVKEFFEKEAEEEVVIVFYNFKHIFYNIYSLIKLF